MSVEDRPKPPRPAEVTIGQAFWVWLRIAMLSFGGPAGQIAVMHRILVEEKRWIGEHRFLHALNYCMVLPGPEAQQLATYIGWLMHRTRGGIIAGGLFVLPGAVSIMALSWIYALYGKVGFVTALFFGLKCAVLAVVMQAVVRIGSRALKNNVMRGLAAVAFVLIFFCGVPFPIIIFGAGLIGYFGGRGGVAAFSVGGGHGAGKGDMVADSDTLLGEDLPVHVTPTMAQTVRQALVWFLLWMSPVAVVLLTLGTGNVFSQIATFFSTMAVVTFGGAYAVLAYMAQEAVQTHGWLAPNEMADGLGLAETTPGPLIMVTQFVGFLGAWRAPDPFAPWLAALLGAGVTTWVTFAPCFLFIFTLAPWIERLERAKRLQAGLAALTAAVVGVIANLALWFALHVLFASVIRIEAGPVDVAVPQLASIDWAAAGIALLAFILAFRAKLGTLPLLAVCAAAGLAATRLPALV